MGKGRAWASVITLAAALGVSACVRSDVASLRTDPGLAYEFRTALSFDKAYEIAIQGFTRCLTGSVLRSTLAIHPEIDREHGTASIAYLQHSFRSGYWATVDFAASGSQTNIKVNTIDNPGVAKLGPELEKWIGGSTECAVGAFIDNHYPLIELEKES